MKNGSLTLSEIRSIEIQYNALPENVKHSATLHRPSWESVVPLTANMSEKHYAVTYQFLSSKLDSIGYTRNMALCILFMFFFWGINAAYKSNSSIVTYTSLFVLVGSMLYLIFSYENSFITKAKIQYMNFLKEETKRFSLEEENSTKFQSHSSPQSLFIPRQHGAIEDDFDRPPQS